MGDPERTALWNEWLKTDDGKSYQAGWGDLWNQLHAARGKAWVAERLIERLRARVVELESELRQISDGHSCCWYRGNPCNFHTPEDVRKLTDPESCPGLKAVGKRCLGCRVRIALAVKP